MPPSARIPVDAVIGFDFVGFAVPGFALLVAALAIGHRFARERRDRSGSRAGAEHTKELTPPQARLALRLHSAPSRSCAAHLPGQCECFCLDFDEKTPDDADVAVELGG